MVVPPAHTSQATRRHVEVCELSNWQQRAAERQEGERERERETEVVKRERERQRERGRRQASPHEKETIWQALR